VGLFKKTRPECAFVNIDDTMRKCVTIKFK